MDLPNRLSYLFGTEECVDLRRQLVLLREYLLNHYNHINGIPACILCSGSLGEGVAYPSSDDDVMICNTSGRVVRTYGDATREYDLLMVPSEYSPGYCLLLDILCSHQRSCIHVINDRSFLSSALFKQFYFTIQSDLFQGQYNGIPSVFYYEELDYHNSMRSLISAANQFRYFERNSIHGPCLSIGNFYIDLDQAYCFLCSFWPDAANDWIMRNRSHGWPSPEIIHNIVNHGCHVVPIGDPDSPLYLHEWRISFSAAERTLMHSLNHVQFLTYNVLRLVLKRVIEKIIPGVLCSYYIKTTIFYVTENTSRHLWQVDNIETCFKSCLSVLYDYIDQRYCPNYFIPEYNIMKRKVNQTNRHILRNLIRNLHSDGIVRTLHLCEESECIKEYLTSSTIELKQDIDLMISYHLLALFDALIFSIRMSAPQDIESFSKILLGIENILRESALEHLMILCSCRVISHYCQILMSSLCILQRANRWNYNLHKFLEFLLRIGYRVDVTTGKLTMATYMYLIGRTESSLSHIRRMLSECPPYIQDSCSTNEVTQSLYIDVMCDRGHSIDYKVRSAWAPPCNLNFIILNAFPEAFKMWICTEQSVVLDPISYAYVIESLCYTRLQNHSSLMKSTRCLIDRIDELDEIFKPEGRMCVGIIKYAQGDCQSACRWMGSLYTMKETLSTCTSLKLQRSAFTYLACLINKRFSSGIKLYHSYI